MRNASNFQNFPLTYLSDYLNFTKKNFFKDSHVNRKTNHTLIEAIAIRNNLYAWLHFANHENNCNYNYFFIVFIFIQQSK
jgi:hypothetical protein